MEVFRLAIHFYQFRKHLMGQGILSDMNRRNRIYQITEFFDIIF